MRCQNTSNEIRQLQVEQAVRRHIHGDPDIETLFLPDAVLSQGMVQHPYRKRLYQTRAFCQRNKFIRRHQIMLRVLPADQRFNLGNLTGLNRGFGLVIQYQFVTFDGVAQLTH